MRERASPSQIDVAEPCGRHGSPKEVSARIVPLVVVAAVTYPHAEILRGPGTNRPVESK